MDSDAFLDQEYENLNDAILQAIVASQEVQDILARFKKQNQINDKAVLNLFLSLNELHEMIDENSSRPGTYKLEPETSTPQKAVGERPVLKRGNIIDGEVLTINEVLFEKFYQGKFNESTWMKKVRLRF